MYYAHFGLTHPPFRITPDTSLFFSGADRGSMLEALTYVVLSGEGITKVIGEVGSGKTMLCRMLEEKLPRHVETIYIANPNIAPENILNVLAFEAGFQSQPDDRLELMHLLQDWLVNNHANNRRVVVLIEEAQGMPVATLEEVRLLSNLETGRDKLLQIVLFGQPELDDKLAQPEIRQLQDRIAHNFYLNALGRDEIRDYANFRVRQAGYHGPDLFDDKVAAAVKRASRGLIRRVNIIADKTLLAAYSDGTTRLTAKHVRTAARDSRFTEARRFGRWTPWVTGGGGIAAGALFAGLLAWALWPSAAPRSISPPAAQTESPSPADSAPRPPKQAESGTPSPAAQPAGDGPSAAPDASLSAGAPVAGDAEVDAEQPPAVESIDFEAELAKNSAQVRLIADERKSGSEADRVEQQAMDESLVEARLVDTLRWLKTADTREYSIQLMMLSGSSLTNLNEYLKELPNTIDLNDIFVYETEIEGDPMIGVLYRRFDSRDQAQAQMQNMPPPFQRIEPFLLRSVRGLRNEITDRQS